MRENVSETIADIHRWGGIRRWMLLALILLAFGRLTWQLDAKTLWWDESLSLQRAESDWLPLIVGELMIKDGFTELLTIDQHPFLYFLLQGILIRLAGTSEFVLRFPSVMAATLLVPAVWVLAWRFVRRAIAPATTAYWAALLAAINPFFLWYGQEARPYALWATLAVISTYLLLRALWNDGDRTPRHALAAYGASAALFLVSHYYAVFLVPIHAILLYQWLAARDRRRAILIAATVLLLGSLVAAAGAIVILRQGGGANFSFVPLRIMLPDLLNAFNMGLSVNIEDVWWLDLIAGALALGGAIWGLRSWRMFRAGGWLLPAFVIAPILVLRVVSSFQPAYMNARHLSLLGGGIIILVAAGLALLWNYRRWVAAALALLLVVGAGYSTANYFTLPIYGKDDYRAAGEYLEEHLLPGDLLILNPPLSWRIFHYYLPVARVQQAPDSLNTAVYGMPMLNTDWESTTAMLDQLRRSHKRIWLVTSGTPPFPESARRVKGRLEESAVRLQELSFYSPTSYLDVTLFLSDVPVFNKPPPHMSNSAGIIFGDQIRLVGYDLQPGLSPESAMPLTLYWQITRPTEDRYKYIARVVETLPDGTERVLATTEREPYEGLIPTSFWKPGEIIMEYSEIPPLPPASEGAQYQLIVQVYRADTLEKLPVARDASAPANGEITIGEDNESLILPVQHILVDRR